MTEIQIKTLRNKSIKQKLSEYQERIKIQKEIDNYETAIRLGGRFVTYNIDQVVKLKAKLLEVGNDNFN